MLYRKPKRHMSDIRFDTWFEAFKAPYTQTKFIHSYKRSENFYSELVIKHLLSRAQKRKVEKFLRNLPRMGPRRFHTFLQKFKKDPTIFYKYSYKDFTKQQLIILYCHMVKYSVRNFI